MAIKLAEIPIIEDIYDFDTITLNEVTEKVQITLKKLDNIEEKDQSQILWLKKAKRYLELALQEIDERKIVENFGNFCVSNNDSILMSNMEDTSGGSDFQNTQNKDKSNHKNSIQQTQNNGQNAFGNVDEWIKLHQQLSQQNQQHVQEKKGSNNNNHHHTKQYSVPHQIKESEQEDDENYSSNQGNNQKTYQDKKQQGSSQKKQKRFQDEDEQGDDEEEDNLFSASVMKNQQKLGGHKNISQGSTDFCNSSMVSGKSISSSASSQAKYLAHQKRIKNKSKQDEMQDFIRQTLEKTRITTNTNVGGSQGMSSYNFHKTTSLGEESSDGKDMNIQRKKKKPSSSTLVNTAELPKRQSVQMQDKPEPASEYSGVQSRIKQELEQQRLKKLDTPYFTTGKASYPKYKPPTVKKVDPDEEKQSRVKNFLKKSKPSIVLPPITQKTTVKSSSADNSSVNGSQRSHKTKNDTQSRKNTAASTESLSEKTSSHFIDMSEIKDDKNVFNSKESKQQNKNSEQLQNKDGVIFNDGNSNLNGETIQEEIQENNIESDMEQKEKIIPGQPRKITKGELFRIKSTRSTTSEKSSASQFGDTPNKYDFSNNPQQFIDEDILYKDDEEDINKNQELKDKLQKTKSRSSLQSIKNTINIEDQSQKNDHNSIQQQQQSHSFSSFSSHIPNSDFNSIKQSNQEQNQQLKLDENNNYNNKDSHSISNTLDNSNNIINNNKQNTSSLPSIIPPEQNGIFSIKTILNKDQDNNNNNNNNIYQTGLNNNVVQRRVEDENPTDSEDDLNEEERLLLYNQAKNTTNQYDINNLVENTNKFNNNRKQSSNIDDNEDDHELEAEERELIQQTKSSKEEHTKLEQQNKQSISQSNLSKIQSQKINENEENKEEEDYQGEDQLDEDESALLKQIKKQTHDIQEYDNEFLVDKYEKDSQEIVVNAKKILENKGINDQLRNRMERLLNNFQSNQYEVEKIEQKMQENENKHKQHVEEVKKNKNQIFGRPSSASKRNSKEFTNNTLPSKQPLKKENKIDEQKETKTNLKDKQNNKDKMTDEQTIKKNNKDDRAVADITNNNNLNDKKLTPAAAAKLKKTGKDNLPKTKEEIQLQNLQQEQEQFIKDHQQMMKKKASAGPPKPPSMTSKLLMKMMKEINDETLIDYTPQIQSFFHLFSGYYNTVWTQNNPMMGGNVGSSINMNLTGGSGNFCLIDQMRDMYQLFQQHVEKVDNADKGLLRYKQVVTPLDVLPSEIYYVNDPQKVIVYQNRVDIDMRKFIERQIIFTQRMNGENFAGHLLPHEEFYYRVVKSKPEVYDIISRSFMRKTDWFELPHGLQLRTSWNLLWTWSKPQIDFNKLLLFQKVNHFPFNKNLVRKDLLKKNFERVTKLGQKAASAFNILPLTFVLPKEYCNFSEKFYEEMLKEGENNIWIMKPVGKSQGRGISLVNDIAQVVYAEPVVVQKYMKDPLLLDGYKFDMRIYALITHMKPLEAFVYKEGFARLSTEKYNLNPQTIKNNQIHLTNFSIQKHHYDPTQNNNFIGGTKISLKMLQEKFRQKGIDWDKIWQQVQEIIVKSVLACQADIPNNPNCFEIFGYDIIIDSSYKCILLEINSSPSLARDFIIDDLIKQQMIDDAIDLVAPVQFDRLRLLEVLDRRIREEQGNKSNINTTNNSKLQLNRDINYILRGQKLRQFGETPNYLGQWQKVAPTEMSDKYLKIIQSYKLPSVRQNTASAANNNNTID